MRREERERARSLAATPRTLSKADFLLDDTTASVETAISVHGYFRLTLAQAREFVAEVESATSRWRQVAADLGLPRNQVDRMAEAYETDQRQLARSMRAA